MSKIEQTTCYCGTEQAYADCCGPYHQGKKLAETAEKLMRARYSAYVVNQINFIAETNDPTAKDDFDKEAAEAWAKESEWLGLEIVWTRAGQPGDAEGEVEFKASYRAGDADHVHHEISLFKPNGKNHSWVYSDGKTMREPQQRAAPKTGRNDPCTCGSGKKFKKCCAA